MRRGEVWWASPRLPGGSGKRRPFLIVSDDAFNLNPAYPKVMAVHLTTVIREGGPYDWEVDLPRGSAGLRHASVIKCGEIYTLLKVHLKEIAGMLSRDVVAEVDRALGVTLGLHRSTRN